MTISDFERTIRTFVASGSGLSGANVIPGNDKNPRPTDAYATLLLVDDPSIGYPIRLQQDDGTTSSASNRRATFSLQFYREGAIDLARDFVIYAESELGLTDAEVGNFRVVQRPRLGYQRLDEVVGDSFEQRTLVNLIIDYVHVTNQDTGVIDQYTGTIDYGALTTTVTHP